jgi:hypothetical protein
VKHCLRGQSFQAADKLDMRCFSSGWRDSSNARQIVVTTVKTCKEEGPQNHSYSADHEMPHFKWNTLDFISVHDFSHSNNREAHHMSPLHLPPVSIKPSFAMHCRLNIHLDCMFPSGRRVSCTDICSALPFCLACVIRFHWTVAFVVMIRDIPNRPKLSMCPFHCGDTSQMCPLHYTRQTHPPPPPHPHPFRNHHLMFLQIHV